VAPVAKGTRKKKMINYKHSNKIKSKYYVVSRTVDIPDNSRIEWPRSGHYTYTMSASRKRCQTHHHRLEVVDQGNIVGRRGEDLLKTADRLDLLQYGFRKEDLPPDHHPARTVVQYRAKSLYGRILHYS